MQVNKHKVIFQSINEPGRITFICNPALSPPTVLLQLYNKVLYYIAATGNLCYLLARRIHRGFILIPTIASSLDNPWLGSHITYPDVHSDMLLLQSPWQGSI